MDLMYVGMTFSDFIVPFIITAVIVFVVCWFMSDYEDAKGALLVGLILGILLGTAGGAAATSNRAEDLKNTFNTSYEFVVMKGRLPTGPNDEGAVVVIQNDGTRNTCMVTTDSTRYNVVCDGAELRPTK